MEKNLLEKYYQVEKKSVAEIAKILAKGESTINYWMKKYNIKKRNISDAVYLRNNPSGDPFKVIEPNSLYLAELKGFGLGLYWGEGNKKNKHSIKLGNTDPRLIQKFIEFLIKILGVKKENLRFSLQVFSDVDPDDVKHHWIKLLGIK